MKKRPQIPIGNDKQKQTNKRDMNMRSTGSIISPPTKVVRRLAAWVLIGPLLIANAQQPQLSPKEAKVKREVNKLSTGEDISVIRRSDPEFYATFTSVEPNGFTCYDIDHKVSVHLAFAEVKKVRQGYGGFNTATRTHTDHTKGLIAGAIVIGAILAVVLIAPSH